MMIRKVKSRFEVGKGRWSVLLIGAEERSQGVGRHASERVSECMGDGGTRR